MNLKFLENIINYHQIKNIATTFVQQAKGHENFVFGTITAANAVTIPLADFLAGIISRAFLDITMSLTYRLIKIPLERKATYFKAINFSKAINFTLFGSIIFTVNKYVISNLLKQNHTKWVLLGTLGLCYLRSQRQTIENLNSKYSIILYRVNINALLVHNLKTDFALFETQINDLKAELEKLQQQSVKVN